MKAIIIKRMNVIVTALLQIFLLVPLCLGDRVRIVQRRGAEVSLSCALPGLAGGWTLCAFSDEDGAECSLSPGEESHPCHDISGARIHVTEDGYCRILLTSLEDNNDGEWSCKVFDQDMEVSRKYFQIHIISEPSWIDFTPRVEDFYDFDLGDPFEASLYVFMVNPQPVIQWTLDDESIPGLHYIQTEILPEDPSNNMEVVQELRVPEMLGVFDNTSLEVAVRIEVVDEFGVRRPEEDYEQRMGFTLRCSYTCYDYETPRGK